MTLDIFSLLILVLAIAGMYAGWRLSIYIGRLLLVVWRLGIAVCGGVLAVYVLYAAWPWLVELQRSGQVYFPAEIGEWRVVIR